MIPGWTDHRYPFRTGWLIKRWFPWFPVMASARKPMHRASMHCWRYKASTIRLPRTEGLEETVVGIQWGMTTSDVFTWNWRWLADTCWLKWENCGIADLQWWWLEIWIVASIIERIILYLYYVYIYIYVLYMFSLIPGGIYTILQNSINDN